MKVFFKKYDFIILLGQPKFMMLFPFRFNVAMEFCVLYQGLCLNKKKIPVRQMSGDKMRAVVSITEHKLVFLLPEKAGRLNHTIFFSRNISPSDIKNVLTLRCIVM